MTVATPEASLEAGPYNQPVLPENLMSTLVPTRSTDSSLPTSGLGQALLSWAEEHVGHAAGPILPCPLCFDPPLDFGATQPSSSRVSSMVSGAPRAVERAAA
jgi:hypothetical protein